MQLIPQKILIKNRSLKPNIGLIILGLLLFSSCATYSPQYGSKVNPPKSDVKSNTSSGTFHRYYLIGDAGNSSEKISLETLAVLKERLEKSDTASTLLFLGDNIYPKGMPKNENSEQRKVAELKLEKQFEIQRNFKGKTVFIPGNHDWYNGLKGLLEQEKFINHSLGENSFLPSKGCGIQELKTNDYTTVIAVDSQWYLEDWDKQKNINANCDIKTREDFLEEFERLLDKNENKIVLVAVHHPLATNGIHGGQTSIKKQIFPFDSYIPLPGIGSAFLFLRKTSGLSVQDIQNSLYRGFINRMKTILGDRENVIFVSGHDHNLQFIKQDNLNQIISGSGSKREAARAIGPSDFSYGDMGYAVLDVFKDGRSEVNFFATKNGIEKLLFHRSLTAKRLVDDDFLFNNPTEKFKTAQIYSNKMTQKSKTYSFFLGEHYRSYYSLEVKAPVLNLEKYEGKINPIKSGDGNQSRTLRIENEKGEQFLMLGMKRSATKFIQAKAFKDQYIEKDLQNNFTENFLLDFYTTINPYYPFAIGELADPLGIYHTNPKLYYVPKQDALGKYNENFGDELFLVEDHPTKNDKNLKRFGQPTDFLSTDELLLALQASDKNKVDERIYIRARLFDMLIKDWDRNEDQWIWAEYKKDSSTTYKPIMRARNQVFPKYDGFFVSLMNQFNAFKHLQHFKEDIPNVKWFNKIAYPLDLALIKHANLDDWLEQAEFIIKNLTDEEIDQSFKNIPVEIKDEEVIRIKELLKIRKNNLKVWAEKYYAVLSRTVVLHATDKQDRIVVNRLPKGHTQIQMFKSSEEEIQPYFEKIYSKKETKSIWIYGLNGDDEFEVNGKPNKPILVRLIGGNDLNSYDVKDGQRVRIYDYPRRGFDFRKTSNAKVYLSNDYEINQYNHEKPKYNSLSFLPSGGYNPDDGVKLGISTTYTINNFDRNPFTRRHHFLANYFFATKGWDLTYTGTFVKFIDKWNLELKARYASPTFTTNFFGFGNETQNFEKEVGMDYNRVKIQSLSFSPSIYYIGRNKGRIDIKTKIENLTVNRDADRITGNWLEKDDDTFDPHQFASAGVKYSYINLDIISLPTLGSIFEIEANWLTNLGDTKKSFPYFVATFGVTQRINTSGKLTFSSLISAKRILNNNFEFYQGASLGGDNDLRGYRIGRFIGRQSFYQTSDLRLQIGQIKKNFFPLKYGIVVGYDYGRVWMDNENSNKWHQSYGGGIWVNGVNVLTGKINYFYGEDGGIISFGVNFGF